MQEYIKIAAYLGAAFTMAIGTVGPAIGQGMIGTKACEMVGKNPDSSSKIQTIFFLAMVFVETSAIYAFVVALMLILWT